MNYFIHIANVIYLSSYAVRDLLWLRILTFCALCLGTTYFATRPDPLLAPVIWQAVSAAINFGQILRIMRERRAGVAKADLFGHLSRDQMIDLLQRASWGSESAAA